MDTGTNGAHTYHRQKLLQLNKPAYFIQDELREKLRDLGLLREPGLQSSALPDARGRRRGHRKRCARKRKRGKRAGVCARLKTNPSRPAFPSIILSNVCSLENKLDYIRLQQATQREVRDCCVFVFTETWLSDRVPDTGIQLDGLASFRADRNAALCGITISNGERWRQLRRFTLTTLRHFGMGRKRMEGWIQEESRHLLESMKGTNSTPFDPTFFLSRAVSNIICALVFGHRFSYEDIHFLRLLQILTGVFRFASSTWGQLFNVFPRLIELLPGKHLDALNKVHEIKSFSQDKIIEHIESLNTNDPRDFIDCFLIRLNEEKDNANTEFFHENLIASVLNLFLAGTETTSTTLRYALLLLIKHPEIQTQMQKEIDAVIGQERSPTMEDRKSLPFTDAVIHEVQRYIDLVPLNLPHYATHDMKFRGYTIPKDTVILPLLHSVLRDEEHWEKPWTFDPKHFLDTNGNFKKNPAFLPFSAGKRSCVGESLARMELFIFLVSLLQYFTFTTPGGLESIDSTPEISGFANLPQNYQLIATPR